MGRTTDDKVALFLSVFKGRRDMFAVANLDKGPKPTYRPVLGDLAHKAVLHLAGKATFGIYPLLTDHTTWFLAIDCDGEGAERECLAFANRLALYEVPSYLERSRSGNGMHLWIFFEEPVPALRARQLGKNILARASLPKSFDRFFPSQDYHSGKGLGNLISLPFQGESQKAKNTVFLDPLTMEPFDCQWTVLENLQRVTSKNLEQALIESQEDPSFVPLPLVNANRTKRPRSAETIQAGTVRIVLAEHLEVIGPYSGPVLDFLKANSHFSNPEWHRLQRAGKHLTGTPRFIRVGGPLGDRWILPRGVWPGLKLLLKKIALAFDLEDRRAGHEALTERSWNRTLELKNYQALLADKVLAMEEAVLLATTGSGKTMIALEVMARRAVPCLILVHNRNLLIQWQERIRDYLGIPTNELGGTRLGSIKIGERITLATFQSLARRELETVTARCALVVVDECHHVPAKSFAAVMRQLRPRYILGLTATARRKDQLEKLIFLYLGTKVKSPTTQDLEKSGDIVLPSLIVRETALSLPENLDHHARLKAVTENVERNSMIASDTIAAVQAGHLVLILTDRTEHCDRLEELLLSKVSLATLHGVVPKKREKLLLEEFKHGQVRVLIATRKRLGEGWDCPPLSTLILAMPISGRGSDLTQMLGRLTRPDPQKARPQFIDYLDSQVGPFKAMFQGRLKIYQETLKPEGLPVDFRPEKPVKRGKATLDYSSAIVHHGASQARDRPTAGPEQLSLF